MAALTVVSRAHDMRSAFIYAWLDTFVTDMFYDQENVVNADRASCG